MACVLKSARQISVKYFIKNLFSWSRTSSNLQRLYSKNGPTSSKNSPFSHSVILLQDGLNIEELPIAVRKATDKFIQSKKPLTTTQIDQTKKQTPSMFKSCTSISSFLAKVNELKTEDVTAHVALQALEKIAELAQNLEYRNQGCIQLSRDIEDRNKSFTLDAVLLQLGSVITKEGTMDELLSSLKLAILPSFPGRVNSLQKMLLEDCLNRILDNKCTISQVCHSIEIFYATQQQDWADKCWVSLIGCDIDSTNILDVFKILPQLKESQRAVFCHIERLLSDYIFHLPVESIIEILSTVEKTKLPKQRICIQTSYWLSRNLHTMNEDSMKSFLVLFQLLDYYDPIFIRSVEQFLKAKISFTHDSKSQSSRIPVDQEFLTVAADYCLKLQVFSPIIFRFLTKGFITAGHNLNLQTIEVILTTFGYCSYYPEDEFKFWSIVEDVVDKKLIQFRPHSLLEILLSCIYLQRYPVNFVPRIFSAHFLHRLNNQELSLVESCRSKIRLLDTALTLECTQYGPNRILPHDYQNKNIRIDGRIHQMSVQLEAPIQEISGDQLVVRSLVALDNLPRCEIYTMDVLVFPDTGSTNSRFGNHRPFTCNQAAIAILIHTPGHYTVSEKRLIGIQKFRIRHLRLMGFHVAHLNWENLKRIISNKDLLHLYLENRLTPYLDECRRSLK